VREKNLKHLMLSVSQSPSQVKYAAWVRYQFSSLRLSSNSPLGTAGSVQGPHLSQERTNWTIGLSNPTASHQAWIT